MTDLLSPKRPYRCNPEATEALEAAKVMFIQYESLSLPDPSLPFVLQTDASARGMGAVLMQQEPTRHHRIIAYASVTFSPTEVVVWAITHYRPYLEDQRFM